MIAVYPFVLIVAIVLATTRKRDGGRGWPWFSAWALAGAIFTFSLLTGFSIGLLLLPLVVATLFFAALRAPHVEEGSGFVAGAGSIAVAVAALNWREGHLNVSTWLAVGLALVAVAVTVYALSRRRARLGGVSV